MYVGFYLRPFPYELKHANRLQGGRVIEFLLQVLGNEESDKVQALICTGFAKLMLSGMISDERVRTLFPRNFVNLNSDDLAGASQPRVDLPVP